MNQIKPMLLTTLKSYDRSQFIKDVTAGIIVAIIALSLSIVTGIFLILMGLCHFGSLIKFIPYTITNDLPSFHMPAVKFSVVQSAIPNAFTIAVLAAIESLLSCVVADGMINGKHRSDTELVAQGLGNIASALFGGIPATGAIARTAANIKNGGRTPVAGMIPMPTIVFSHVNEQPMKVMKKAGFIELVGKEHFCPNISAALKHAEDCIA